MNKFCLTMCTIITVYYIIYFKGRVEEKKIDYKSSFSLKRLINIIIKENIHISEILSKIIINKYQFPERK